MMDEGGDGKLNILQKATYCNATVGKGLNPNAADRALREWADCPCALQQVHLLALDGTKGPVLAPPDGRKHIRQRPLLAGHEHKTTSETI